MVSLLLAISAATACGGRVTSGSQREACLAGAAEKFEGIAESVTGAPTTALAAKVRDARVSAGRCARFLNRDQADALARADHRLEQAFAARDGASVALFAIENYRILVSAQTRAPSDVPLEVALLDYAGFRYQAGAKATPLRWEDMRIAEEFAEQQWAVLSSRIADAGLRAEFASNLTALRTALEASDPNAARHAAVQELDGVDALERYFANSPRR